MITMETLDRLEEIAFKASNCKDLSGAIFTAVSARVNDPNCYEGAFWILDDEIHYIAEALRSFYDELNSLRGKVALQSECSGSKGKV